MLSRRMSNGRLMPICAFRGFWGGCQGYLPHEIQGQNALHFVPMIFRDFADDTLQQALLKVSLVSYRLATYGRSGELIWNKNRLLAVRQRGRICGFVALSTYVDGHRPSGGSQRPGRRNSPNRMRLERLGLC